MYIILDKSLRRIGTLSLDKSPGACPFWGDEIDLQIADDDSALTLDEVSQGYNSEFNAGDPHSNTKSWNHTLTSINVPYGYAESAMIEQGNCLAYYDVGTSKWYVMRLTDVTDNVDASGTHYKSAVGVNLAIWDMGHTVVRKVSFDNATVRDVFTSLMSNTSWTIGEIDLHGSNPQASVNFDGQANAQSQLQSVCQIFDIEVDAYVEFDKRGNVARKRIDIVDKLGQDNGQFIRYGDNATAITRTVSDANLYTRLYPVNGNGTGIESVNNGVPYVQDTAANDLYNTQIDGEGEKYLEGTITSSTIQNLSALKAWAQSQLKIFNHPRANYTITGQFVANIGDRVKVQDLKMQPVLTTDSRVIQTKISQANPETNEYVVGEFTTVNVDQSSLLNSLQNQLNEKIQILIDEVKDGTKSCTVYLITPNGTNWSQEDDAKSVIARVFVDQVNITSYFSAAAFSWTKTDPSTGIHDADWEAKHEADGYQLQLDDGDVGTITCTVDGDYLKTSAELTLGVDNKLFWDKQRVDLPNDFWNTKINGAFQYIWYDEVNQQLIASMEYLATDGGTAPHSANATDTKYFRFKMDGTYVDAMVFLGGGHGASFGARLVDGVPEIWSSTTDQNGQNARLSAFKWQPNTVVSQTSGSTTICDLPAIGAWKYRRISVDFDQGWVLGITGNGWVEVVKIEDVLAGNWIASYKFKLQSVGFNIINNTTNDGTHATMQSNDIHFPYIYTNAGDVNGLDPRIVAGINLITESVVFWQVNTSDQFGAQWLDQTHDFEPETVGYYEDEVGPYLLQGFNTETILNTNTYLHRTLFKTYLTVRDDSGDVVTYPPDSQPTSDESEVNAL